MKGLKKILFGSSNTDKNDPKYKEAYDKGFAAGQQFADKYGISWLAAKVQYFGLKHKVLFLCIVFGTVMTLFSLNIIHFVRAYQSSTEESRKRVPIERLDSLKKKTSVNKKMIHYEQD